MDEDAYLRDHAKNEFSHFPANALPARPNVMPREPRPVQSKSSAVPAHDGFWCDHNQDSFPAAPPAGFLGARRIPREILRSERSKPSIATRHECRSTLGWVLREHLKNEFPNFRESFLLWTAAVSLSRDDEISLSG
jgi:hypothetical protein